jgi:hypothetical protein
MFKYETFDRRPIFYSKQRFPTVLLLLRLVAFNKNLLQNSSGISAMRFHRFDKLDISLEN